MGEMSWGLPPGGVGVTKSGSWRFDRADVVKIQDGDTVWLDVVMDTGFGDTLTRLRSFRLYLGGKWGINARELDMAGGPAARDNLAALLPIGTPLRLESVKNDKYGGRFDAVLWLGDLNIGEHLIREEWAARWDGTGKAPVPPWPRTIAGTGP